MRAPSVHGMMIPIIFWVGDSQKGEPLDGGREWAQARQGC